MRYVGYGVGYCVGYENSVGYGVGYGVDDWAGDDVAAPRGVGYDVDDWAGDGVTRGCDPVGDELAFEARAALRKVEERPENAGGVAAGPFAAAVGAGSPVMASNVGSGVGNVEGYRVEVPQADGRWFLPSSA